MNARWLPVGCPLAGFVAPPPRYVARMLRGPALPRSPRAPLPLSAPRWGRVVSRLWRCVFRRGALPPRSARHLSPRAPLPLFLSLLLCVCVRPWFIVWSGGGFRGPSVSFRPPRLRPDVGRPPMSLGSRPRSSLHLAFGRGARSGGVLGSLRSLRFKRPRLRAPAPSRLATARFRLSLYFLGMRFCHVNLTKR